MSGIEPEPPRCCMLMTGKRWSEPKEKLIVLVDLQQIYPQCWWSLVKDRNSYLSVSEHAHGHRPPVLTSPVARYKRVRVLLELVLLVCARTKPGMVRRLEAAPDYAYRSEKPYDETSTMAAGAGRRCLTMVLGY